MKGAMQIYILRAVRIFALFTEQKIAYLPVQVLVPVINTAESLVDI